MSFGKHAGWIHHTVSTMSPRPVYLATSRRWDEEHCARIDRHRADRGPEWITVEEPLQLSQVTSEHPVIVVDCVTLWLTNVFEGTGYELDRALAMARTEIDRCLAQTKTWIWVSNELGQGVHAATEAARRFVDLQGFINQYLAAKADTVTLLVAGIPLVVKGTLP